MWYSATKTKKGVHQKKRRPSLRARSKAFDVVLNTRGSGDLRKKCTISNQVGIKLFRDGFGVAGYHRELPFRNTPSPKQFGKGKPVMVE